MTPLSMMVLTPEGDLGYLCFREKYKWLVSGFVNSAIAKNQIELDNLIYEIAENLLNIDESLSVNVSIVKLSRTLFANCEEEDKFI
ncbi:MAG: hypothetical protein AAGA80_08560 [Cyanobacteria bacterium P01_F01_bin.143]